MIGANAITIYLLDAFIDFDGFARLLLGHADRRLHPIGFVLAGLGLRWLLLWAMYRRRIFLRV